MKCLLSGGLCQCPLRCCQGLGQDLLLKERKVFFDRYPILEYWLPGGMDASTVDMICAFMGWLDIVTECPSHGFTELSLARHLSEKNNMRPCIAWLWLKSEHLQINVMHDIVREASLVFYKWVAWCSVYQPDVYRQHFKIVTAECEKKLAICHGLWHWQTQWQASG